MGLSKLNLREEIVQELIKIGIKRFDKPSAFVRNDRRAIDAGFSNVYAARNESDDPDVARFAIKVIKVAAEQLVNGGGLFLGSRNTKVLEYFKRECSILNACAAQGHEESYFMEFLGTVDTFNGSLLPGMVFSYAKEGNLKNYLTTDAGRTLTTKEKLKFMTHLIKAISHLHGLKMIHRDIKAENVLLDRRDGELIALLSDLGSARDFSGLFVVADSSLMSSIEWCPPEFFSDADAPRTAEDGSGDVWSYGCTVIEVLASLTPPWPVGYEHVEDDLLDGLHPPRPSKPGVPDEVWNFLERRCFCADPFERISSKDARIEMLKLYNSAP